MIRLFFWHIFSQNWRSQIFVTKVSQNRENHASWLGRNRFFTNFSFCKNAKNRKNRVFYIFYMFFSPSYYMVFVKNCKNVSKLCKKCHFWQNGKKWSKMGCRTHKLIKNECFLGQKCRFFMKKTWKILFFCVCQKLYYLSYVF